MKEKKQSMRERELEGRFTRDLIFVLRQQLQ